MFNNELFIWQMKLVNLFYDSVQYSMNLSAFN